MNSLLVHYRDLLATSVRFSRTCEIGNSNDSTETNYLARISNGTTLHHVDWTKAQRRRRRSCSQDRAFCADHIDIRHVEAHAEGPAGARQDHRRREAARSVVPASGLEWERFAREEAAS